MMRASAKALFPTLVVVMGGLLVGLLVASPSLQPPPPDPVADEGPDSLPWGALERAKVEFQPIQQARSQKRVENQVQGLTELYETKGTSPRLRGLAAFAAARVEFGRNRESSALEFLAAPELEATELGGYALYLEASELESSNPRHALAALLQLIQHYPDFTLMDDAQLRAAKLSASLGDREAAIAILRPATMSDDEEGRGAALNEMATLLLAEGRTADAVMALETLYYQLPRHELARSAGRRLTSLRGKLPKVDPRHLYNIGFQRAETLREQRRYRDAYNGYAGLLQRFGKVADVSLVRLRMGECQYRRRQLSASVVTFKKVTAEPYQAEALFYQSEVARRKRQRKGYAKLSSEILSRYSNTVWAEKTLYNLGVYHQDQEDFGLALSYFKRVVQEFPGGELFLDAQWHVLWDAYNKGEYPEAGFGFEETARSRPGTFEVSRFLYWGGRAYEEAGDVERASALYRQVLLGYQNTYYGRRAYEHLSGMSGQRAALEAIESARRGIDLSDALLVDRKDRQQRIADLYAVGMPKEALQEAKTAVDGARDDAAFLAMAAWIHSDQHRNLQAIIAIREAFPFHVSATGDLLPDPIWKLFYPLPYWDHVRTYAEQRDLDPYLVAALIRQESTFNPRVRSRAGARGLMQIIPATGQGLARQEKRRYSTNDLYNPEINIRYGTRYLRQVLASFKGRVDYALAGYNAGPHRVKRWTKMDMSIDPEVFIEEIPFDETRTYVKLVLRNEMLYRRLYGGESAELAAAE